MTARSARSFYLLPLFYSLPLISILNKMNLTGNLIISFVVSIYITELINEVFNTEKTISCS